MRKPVAVPFGDAAATEFFVPVGLPDYGTRRVPGLRREEVAVLAGLSVPGPTRLERGDLAGASDGVLDALARALHLGDAERHLFDLARAAQPIGPPPRRRPAKHRIRPSVQQLLDAMTAAAAHIAKHLHHAEVGDLEPNYERLEVVSDTGLTIFACTADPGTRSAEAFSPLGSLAATTVGERTPTAP